MISSRNNQQNSLYVNYISGWNVSFLISLKLNAQKCKTPIHNKWSDLKWCEANREQQKKNECNIIIETNQFLVELSNILPEFYFWLWLNHR